MRILYVINSLNIGGAEKLCVDLAKIAQQKGSVIDIYVLNNVETFFTKELKKSGIKIFNAGANNYKSIKHVVWLLKNKNKYDVIHSHLSYSQYFVSIIRLFDKKIKLVTTEHSTFNQRRALKIFKIFEKIIYSSYDKITVINKENLQSMIEWQPSIQEKLVIINNGIDIERYRNGDKEKVTDKELTKVRNKKKILMIAAYRKEKNHMFMLKVIKELDKNMVLILVGDGEERIKNEINIYIQINNLEERVIQLGQRSDIENIIKFCDVGVLPSLWEGFGLVAAECMAGGLPIVGSNVNGLSEVIGNKDLLFEANNKLELINRLEKNIKKNKEIVEYCEERAKKYSIERTLEQYLKCYTRK